jgi:hypothetical protein
MTKVEQTSITVAIGVAAALSATAWLAYTGDLWDWSRLDAALWIALIGSFGVIDALVVLLIFVPAIQQRMASP